MTPSEFEIFPLKILFVTAEDDGEKIHVEGVSKLGSIQNYTHKLGFFFYFEADGFLLNRNDFCFQ